MLRAIRNQECRPYSREHRLDWFAQSLYPDLKRNSGGVSKVGESVPRVHCTRSGEAALPGAICRCMLARSTRVSPRVACVWPSQFVGGFFWRSYMKPNGLRWLIDSAKKVEWEMLRMFSLIGIAALLLATTAIFLLTQIH
jgi:hypothetical protein